MPCAPYGAKPPPEEKFELWKQYFTDLMAETAKAYANGATLEQAQDQVSKALIPKYASKFNPEFPHDMIPNVTKAYQVIAFPQ